MENYLSMTDPSRAQTVDSDIAQHCAYSLPAVAYTLGKDNWKCLRSLYETLVTDMQVKTRLVYSLHELWVHSVFHANFEFTYLLSCNCWDSFCKMFVMTKCLKISITHSSTRNVFAYIRHISRALFIRDGILSLCVGNDRSGCGLQVSGSNRSRRQSNQGQQHLGTHGMWVGLVCCGHAHVLNSLLCL